MLELGEEQRVVAEAYEFLDEKRLLLAAELLRQLERYELLLDEIEALGRSARQQLVAAVQRHGLQELSVYPATPLVGVGIDLQQRNVMGVTLLDARLTGPDADHRMPPVASQPSSDRTSLHGGMPLSISAPSMTTLRNASALPIIAECRTSGNAPPEIAPTPWHIAQ